MNTIAFPELFFCLAAPIGTDLDGVSLTLQATLNGFGYDVELIHVTKSLPSVDESFSTSFDSFSERYNGLIESANRTREKFDDDAIMARLAIMMISERRQQRATSQKIGPVAYIVRQLKRPEEIDLFREIYGKLAFQISAYAEPEARRIRLTSKMQAHDRSSTRADDFEEQAIKLLRRDENESRREHGQRLRDIFPLADVFIDAKDTKSAEATTERFLKLVFGSNEHSPTREEYGMYVAKSASLRSLDLSRQVGAAIFSPSGEIKTLGCNEVPSPRGGTYWEGDAHDGREYRMGYDTNEDFKYRLLNDTLIKLSEAGIIQKEFTDMEARDFVAEIKAKKGVSLEKSLMMMDIIEYGRIIHAEMNAITDAARKGVAIHNATLYCTTFPCHLCAKHIISSGIRTVTYIEPYPKSYAKELYRDDIVLSRSEFKSEDKVYFEPFIGISPYRYRDLFERSKRKDRDGKFKKWHFGDPQPLINTTDMEYTKKENEHLRRLAGKISDLKINVSQGQAPQPDSAARKAPPKTRPSKIGRPEKS